MAARKAFARVQAVLGLLGVLAILITYSLITGWNPLPSLSNWIANATVRSLSDPATTWVKRAGNQPVSAAVVGSYVVVATEGSVEVHGVATGEKLWEQPATWAVTAGDTQAVAVVGRVADSGFDAYDVATGIRLWGSNDRDGVWAYSDEILLLRCGGDTKCTLRGVDPASGSQRWRADLDGAGRSLLGAGHSLAALAPITSAYARSLAATPGPAPDLIGLPMAGAVHVVNTANGKQLKVFPVNQRTRSIVVGHTVITTTATFVNGQCDVAISGQDPSSGATIWTKTGYDPKTTGGMACDQRRDPAGGGDAVRAVDSAGRDVLIRATDGRLLFTAKKHQKIMTTDSSLAVVRTAGKKSLYAMDLRTRRQQWTRPAASTALVGVTPDAVLLADPALERLVAVRRDGDSTLLDVKSGATVLGVGANQLIINVGRSFGPLSLSGTP